MVDQDKTIAVLQKKIDKEEDRGCAPVDLTSYAEPTREAHR